MAKETELEIGKAAKPCKFPARLLADLPLRFGDGVAHPLLDIPLAPLLRVQFQGLSRQPVQVDLGMLGEEAFDYRGPVGLQAFPDHDLRPGDLTTEVFLVRVRRLPPGLQPLSAWN